jgi:hypothetical protein
LVVIGLKTELNYARVKKKRLFLYNARRKGMILFWRLPGFE